jgi:hypothetical protein
MVAGSLTGSIRLCANQRLFVPMTDAVVEILAWYFPDDAVAFVLRGDFSAALASNLPASPRDGAKISFENP